MKDSLLNLQRGIGVREYSSEAEEKRSRYHWHTARRPRGHAVQYGACIVCEAVCRQQQNTERESGQRGRRDQQSAGPADAERGTVVSSAQRFKPPRRRKSWTGGAPTTHSNWGVPIITEALWEVARLAPSFYLWNNRFLLLSYFQVRPTVSRVEAGSAGERDGKLLHACRQPSSPQSVLMWSSSSLCVSNKRRTEDKKRSSQRKGRRGWGGGGRFLSSLYGFLRSPDCSKPIVP